MLKVSERRSAQHKRETAELIEQLGPGRVATLLQVHRTTVDRWSAGQVEASEAVRLAIKAALGRLPGMDSRHWEGWSIGVDGLLYAPGDRRGYHAGHILSLPYLHQLVAHQRRQLQLLQEKLDALDTGAANSPVEGEIGSVSDQALDYTIGRTARR